MQEEEGKEDKFEFDATGQALEYIALDQARTLATQTAREQPGNYGRRWRRVPMVFVVTEAQETEDDYVLTLCFRPEGEFAGTPGIE